MDIRFVSYSGDYPSLCCGILKLTIDGQRWVFDRYCSEPEVDANGDIHSSPFWISGGCAGVDSECNSFCITDPWELDAEEIPEQLKGHEDELIEIFNDNVPWGCCGGCI